MKMMIKIIKIFFVLQMIALCKDPKGDKIFQQEKVADVLTPGGQETVEFVVK